MGTPLMLKRGDHSVINVEGDETGPNLMGRVVVEFDEGATLRHDLPARSEHERGKC